MLQTSQDGGTTICGLLLPCLAFLGIAAAFGCTVETLADCPYCKLEALLQGPLAHRCRGLQRIRAHKHRRLGRGGHSSRCSLACSKRWSEALKRSD